MTVSPFFLRSRDVGESMTGPLPEKLSEEMVRVDKATLEKLKQLAAESDHDNPDLNGKLHRLAEATLSIRYNESDVWGINHTRPNKSIISINSRMVVDQVMAQLRGMMADFAARQVISSANIANLHTRQDYDHECSEEFRKGYEQAARYIEQDIREEFGLTISKRDCG